MVSFGIADCVGKKDNIDIPELIKKFSKKIDTFQLYIDQNLLYNLSLQKEIKKLINETGIDIIFHAPTSLGEIKEIESILNVIYTVGYSNNKNILIFHQKKMETKEKLFWEAIHILNKYSIVPYIENYNKGIDRTLIEEFISIYRKAKNPEVIGAVIDIPRYFNHEKNTNKSYEEVIKTIKSIMDEGRYNIIFHAIDTTFIDQDNRIWCPIGEGRIPYKKIFHFVKNEKANVTQIILEYESIKETEMSIVNLKNLLHEL